MFLPLGPYTPISSVAWYVDVFIVTAARNGYMGKTDAHRVLATRCKVLAVYLLHMDPRPWALNNSLRIRMVRVADPSNGYCGGSFQVATATDSDVIEPVTSIGGDMNRAMLTGASRIQPLPCPALYGCHQKANKV